MCVLIVEPKCTLVTVSMSKGQTDGYNDVNCILPHSCSSAASVQYHLSSFYASAVYAIIV